MADFPDDQACAEHLAGKRWPNGFVCPHCGSSKGWRLAARPWVYQCGGRNGSAPCRRQTSVIAGTVMHGSHLPLRTWFIAAYLVATHSNAISALQLQSKLGLGSYKTAWLLLHKLRRAMVNPDRTPLAGDVEVDEASVPFRRKTDPITGGQGKSTVGKVFIIGAVERLDGGQAGRSRPSRGRARPRSALFCRCLGAATLVPLVGPRDSRVPRVKMSNSAGSAMFAQAHRSPAELGNRRQSRRPRINIWRQPERRG